MQSLEELQIRKNALNNSINSYKKHIAPLEKELKEIEKTEIQIKKELEKNKEDGV